MQRDETASPATVEILEEPKPVISLEELVPDLPSEPVAEAAPSKEARREGPQRAVLGLRTGRILSLDGKTARVALRGGRTEIEAELAPEVEHELIAEAVEHRESVLVEVDEDGAVVVGVVQTRKPREVVVKGEKVVVEGEREVLLRAGRAALRLREDGDVELVGSRISAASRGLFRIVGRILRLN